MNETVRMQIQPRRMPVQARSTASVEAILEATLQVLLAAGKDRMTTTAVARRAGVSVGTLYQYFPNKRSLLQALLRAKMERVAEAVEAVCVEQRGQPLDEMGTALVRRFLAAKLRDVNASAALYSISEDLGGVEIVRKVGERVHGAIAGMLLTAQERLGTEPEVAAHTVEAAMAGVSRRMLDAALAGKRGELEAMRGELEVLVRAYLRACMAG